MAIIYQLVDNNINFPDPLSIPAKDREPTGLFALGGDLNPERLIEAYSMGIFPWTSFRDLEVEPGERKEWWNQLHWYCPVERFVIFPNEIHISHSMRTLLNKGEYLTTLDQDFDAVINNCGALRMEEEGAWLGPQMIEAYTKLHEMDYAHSIETWHNGRLIGGLYGVTYGNAFFGESMFSLEPNGSKIALISLAQRMAKVGGAVIDCQFETPHLRSMGARYIPYSRLLDLIHS